MVDYQTAMRQLMNKPYLRTPEYREQQGSAEREGAKREILEFEKAFVRDLRRRGIPFYAKTVYLNDVDLIHSLRGFELDLKSWAIIGHVGKEVAKRIGVEVLWGGDDPHGDPAYWQLAG